MNPSPVTITLTQDELLRISDALLHVIAHNNKVAATLIGIDDKIVRQIAEGNEKLRDLNRRICESMTE